MKTLIAYYSKTGNTERVAKELETKLSADLEKIIDKKKRGGIFGFIFGGRDAIKKKLTEIETLSKNLADYDLIILGTPNWGTAITPALRTYIEKQKADFKNVAFFQTSGGGDEKKLASSVEEVVGKKLIATVGFNTAELKDKNIYDQKITTFINTINK